MKTFENAIESGRKNPIKPRVHTFSKVQVTDETTRLQTQMTKNVCEQPLRIMSYSLEEIDMDLLWWKNIDPAPKALP